jgi:peptide-methionine (S)-S-oxide reductase
MAHSSLLKYVFAAATLTLTQGTSVNAQAGNQTAVLAGGCFWGVEAVFEHVKGVRNVVSGYAGGTRRVGMDRTSGPAREGFAEAVRITFDPSQVSYNQLLQIFFDVAHDPTQEDRQGPDVGPRYRSAIFPQNAQQRAAAQQFIAQLKSSNKYGKPIATKIESGGFDVAETEHQDFVRKNPRTRYVVVYDLPKLAELRQKYPRYWQG